jgi:predicted protein tyrosine phosphatase
MKIIVLSKFEIENTELNPSHIVISITDDEKYFPDISEKNCLGILKIAVWDTEDGKRYKSIHHFDASEVPGDKIFNMDHARNILEFVFKHLQETEVIVCQCDLGLSRSAGTAAALSRILNGDDEEFWDPSYIPNKLVYRTILGEYRKMRKGENAVQVSKTLR